MPKASKEKAQRSASTAAKDLAMQSPKPLTASEEAEIAAFQKRMEVRPPAAEIAVAFENEGLALDIPEGIDSKLFKARLLNSLGLTDLNLASRLASDLVRMTQPAAKEPPSNSTVNAALAIVHGVTPQDEIEALLAVQMAGTHNAAVEMLRRATQSGDVGHMTNYGNLATKLLRTYTAQVEALNRHRGKGQQKVTVKHVHVHEGGQAIVGTVEGVGGQNKTEDQSHAKQIAYAPDTPMPRLDAQRNGVPVTGGEGEITVPYARRD